jgi:hypothetical protein
MERRGRVSMPFIDEPLGSPTKLHTTVALDFAVGRRE